MTSPTRSNLDDALRSWAPPPRASAEHDDDERWERMADNILLAALSSKPLSPSAAEDLFAPPNLLPEPGEPGEARPALRLVEGGAERGHDEAANDGLPQALPIWEPPAASTPPAPVGAQAVQGPTTHATPGSDRVRWVAFGVGLATAAAGIFVLITRHSSPSPEARTAPPVASSSAAPVLVATGKKLEPKVVEENAKGPPAASVPRTAPPSQEPKPTIPRPPESAAPSLPIASVDALPDGGPKPQLAAGGGSSSAPDHPSTASVGAALRGGAMTAARECVRDADGDSSAEITFASDGSVIRVNVSGWAATHQKQDCLDRAFRSARVEPFSRTSFAVTVPIRGH